MTSRIYLDHAATTPLRPEARTAMEEGFRIWANPSSPHAEGRRARAALEDARARIKAALGWQGELIFTGGASEALAIGLGRAKVERRIVSAVEHDAVFRAAPGAEIAAVGPDGAVDRNMLAATLALPGRPVVAIQHANSETGALQPLAELAPMVREAGGILLADCAQSAGKLALPDADLLVISAHKFGGPVGIGALLVRDFALLEPTGGQERGYRAGTENLPGAMAMAAALEAGSDWLEQTGVLRSSLDKAIIGGGGEVLVESSPRIASIASYRMPGLAAAAQLIRFDAMGFAVSAGSACSSGSLKTSRVLEGMGYPHPDEVVRVSFGWNTTRAEVERFCAAWLDMAGGSA